jgi:DNA polymerase-3 subunit delta'
VPSFRDTLGHHSVKSLLASAIARGSLPPTLMLAGPAGVGKYRLGLATAAALNCLEPIAGQTGLALDACGRCRACDRIARQIHVDLVTLAPDDNALIKIDVVRDALDRTGYRPFEGRKRVVIIREADTMQPPAQNALLKSLEEPPPGTVFMLTTAVPGMLLPTVRSRCMRLRLGRLTEAEVVAVLTRDYEMTDEQARSVAALADGSVGLAVAVATADLSAVRDRAIHLLDRAARGAVPARLQAAVPLVTESPGNDRERTEVALAMRVLASMVRDIELINANGDPRLLANSHVADQLRRLAPSYRGDRARAAFAALSRAIEALGPARNAGVKVVGDWIATQI